MGFDSIANGRCMLVLFYNNQNFGLVSNQGENLVIEIILLLKNIPKSYFQSRTLTSKVGAQEKSSIPKRRMKNRCERRSHNIYIERSVPKMLNSKRVGSYISSWCSEICYFMFCLDYHSTQKTYNK